MSYPQRPPATEHAAHKQRSFHADVLGQVVDAVATHDIVVVGMSLNPNVSRARKALDAAGLQHTYLGFGGYGSQWKQRLAIKLWSGWPTYPQVFVHGRLVGGADQTQHMLKSGELQALLDQGRAAS